MKCRYEHDGDCCNSGATQYMCKCKKPCDTIMPITNADRIRAMSDEELAKFIGEEGFHCEICSKGVNSECDLRCSTYCLEWLQQPAEE